MLGFFKRINDLQLKKKLILTYSLAIFLPVCIIGYFFISSVTNETLKHDKTSKVQNDKLILSTVDSFLGNYIMLSNNLKYDLQLTGFLTKAYSSKVEFIDKYFDYYNIYSSYSKNLAYQTMNGTKFFVYTTNSDIVCYNDFVYRCKKEDTSSDWFTLALENSKKCSLCSPTTKKGLFAISMVTDLTPKSSTDNILRIDIPEKFLYSLIESEAPRSTVYIVNSQYDVITTTDRDSVSANLKDTKWNQLIDQISATEKEVVLNQNNNTIYIAKVGRGTTLANCWLVIVTPSDYISGQLNAITLKSLGICLLVVTIDIILIVILSQRMTARISKLSSAVQAVHEGNLEVSINTEGNDEIAQFSKAIKQMIDRINELINKVYASELHLKDAQLKTKEAEIHALQSQVNPHFLFNFLECIKTNVLKNNDLESCDIIVSFSRLMRKSIDWNNDFILLENEIDLVGDYLKIQKYRYREKLNYNIVSEKRLKSIVVPKFIMQPIVENSISHGIEAKKDGGTVTINCEEFENKLRITVQDDGIGIEKEQLAKLRKTLMDWAVLSTESDHIGLLNVQQRLKLYYGEEYGLRIFSERGAGTTVSLLLPLNDGYPPDSPGKTKLSL